MKKGQTLLEIILALAIFSMIAGVLASMAVGGMTALTGGGDLTRADALLVEGIEKVRLVRDGAWNAIVQPPQEIIDGRYTRDVTIADVDIHTKKITATVSWDSRPGITNSVERETYISNWDSKMWIQTDWRGGSGQAIWLDLTKFDLVSIVDGGASIDFNTSGEIKLAQNPPGSGTWASVVDVQNMAPARQLNAVKMINATDVWALGNSAKAFHYFNGVWSSPLVSVSNPANSDIRGLDMISASDGWAVGSSGKIIRCKSNGSSCDWDASAPGSIDTGNETWNAVSMLADGSEGWAVGDSGVIARYQSGSWSTLPLNQRPVTQNLNAIDMVSSTDGWAIGASGRVIRYLCPGGVCAWRQFTGWIGAAPNATWQGIHMFDQSHGWIVGNQGLIYQWNSAQQKWGLLYDTGGDTWYGVRALASDDLWIVGSGGKIGYWNGTMNIQAPPGVNILRAIDVYKNPDTSVTGFAVGDVVNNKNTVLRLTRLPVYKMQGELISSAFDMTDASPIQVLEWQESNPCSPQCRVRIQISRENSSGTINWRGPDGTPSTYFEGVMPILVPASFNGFRWLRYKIRLEGPGSNTPKLEEIRINYK